MKIDVRIFAVLKDYFDHNFSVTLAPNATVKDLMMHLTSQNPLSEGILSKCRAVIDEEFVEPLTPLYENAEICIIPPSSGG